MATPGARVIARLQALGVPVLALDSRNLGEVQRSLVVLARKGLPPVDYTPEQFEKNVDREEARKAKMQARKAAGAPKPPVVLPCAGDRPETCQHDSIGDYDCICE